jgi:hypothetical protein
MTLSFNKISEKEKRRSLRKNMPKSEVILWSKLKNKQMQGKRFLRQYSVDQYVIDFYSSRGGNRPSCKVESASFMDTRFRVYYLYLLFTKEKNAEGKDEKRTPLNPPFQKGESPEEGSSSGRGVS